MQAATLETLENLVAAGYGVTLIPPLAAIRLTSRPGFPRPHALRTQKKVMLTEVDSAKVLD